MTTKITLDPALVRSVLGISLEDNAISIQDDFIFFEKSPYIDGEIIEGIIYNEAEEPCIDIHRFKDMAIKWCAGKGYLISPSVISLDGLKIEIHKAHRHVNDDYSPHNWYMSSYLVEYFMHRDYPDKLSAELAAISFVWEQIQKEKNNEH